MSTVNTAKPYLHQVAALLKDVYPDIAWTSHAQGGDLVVLNVYVDVANAWRIHELARPILNEAARTRSSNIVLVVLPRAAAPSTASIPG